MNFLLRLLIAMIFIIQSFSVYAETPRSGSIVENRAEVIYYDDVVKSYNKKYSNIVSLTIATIIDFELTPKELFLEKFRDENFVLSHQLENKSNTEINLNLEIKKTEESLFNIINKKQYIDENKNGIIDSNDTIINEGVNSLNFKIDEIKNIIITGTTPSIINYGDFTALSIIAEMPSIKRIEAYDKIITLAESELNISSYANKESASQNETVIFNYDLNNESNADALPQSIFINSEINNFIVVESSIPENTTFTSKESGNEDLFVYHLSGFPDDSYTTQKPILLSSIDKVAFLYKNFKVNRKELGSYTVEINNNASEQIKTNYEVKYKKTKLEEIIKPTKDMIVLLPEINPELDNFDDNFLDVRDIIRIDSFLNLRANAARCNTSISSSEELLVNIKTKISKDNENIFIMKETNSNSGIFEIDNIPTRNAELYPIESNNGILEVNKNDEITVELTCNNIVLNKTIFVDPLSVVFDSSTNQPIPNIKVILKGVDEFGNTFIPDVSNLEGDKISNEQITDNNGFYYFPIVEEGKYIIEIENNLNYSYPSVKSENDFDDIRIIDSNGSFGKVFSSKKLNENNVILIDIPLDPIVNNNILINKEADRSVAYVGDIVEYTISIKNASSNKVKNLKLVDTLPLGLELMSAKGFDYNVNKNVITFNIPEINSNSEMQVNYKVLVKINAPNGDGVNTAQLFDNIYTSNISTHKLDIRQESIFENPLIMGKVFKDCNNDSIKGEGEIGIPGVKIYLNNGYYAITDKNGNYKFYNLKAKTYVVRIDKSSLPKPYDFKIINNRNAKDPLSAFADLKYGELHRTDFRDVNCSEESLNSISKRVENLKEIKSEVEKSAEKELNFETNIVNDLQTKEDSGVINDQESNISKIYSGDIKETEVPKINTDDLKSKQEEKKQLNIDEDKIIKSVQTTIDLEIYAKESNFNNEISFVDLESNDIISKDQVSIRIKGPSAGKIQLLVNNKLIEDEKVGQMINFKDKNLKVIEYVAVKLNAGENIIETRMVDPFGNVRGSNAIRVLAVGKLEKIKFNLPEGNKIPANSNNHFPIIITLTDENGLKVSGKYVITLKTTIGEWDVNDINEDEEGIQATIENGEAVFDLIPPSSAEKGQLKAIINDIEEKEDIFATTYLRDMFAVGIVEGMFDFNNKDLKNNISKTGLENEISSFEMIDGANARTSLFLKGKVKGDFLLTLAYDSDKDSNEKLYKDIEPEEFYPIYGDSSINGFEAQSTSKLFVKIAKDNSYIMYGDFNTKDYSDQNINIGNYNRTLTGIKHVYQKDKITLNYYVAQENFGSRVKELESTGGFGPYNFAGKETVIENSEKVTVITRDKNTGAVISEVIKTRLKDYEINGFYDGIIFREPIPTVDSDFNKNYIKIEYETDSNGENYLVYGVKGSYAITKDVSFGLNYNTSREKENEFEITSTNINYDKNGLKANIELAESNKLNSKGYGAKLNVKYNKEGHSFDLRAETADKNFNNEYASVSSGRTNLTLKTKNKLNNTLSVKNDIYYVKETELNKENRSIKTSLEKTINPNLRIESGLRFNQGKVSSVTDNSTMASGKIIWQPEYLKKLNTYAEYEQDINISEVNRLEMGVEYAISEKGKLYLKQEKLTNLISEIEKSDIESKTTKTIVGTNYDLTEKTDLYSEYRIDDAINQNDAEAAVGVRNRFKINEKWEGNVSLERIETVKGEKASSSSIATTLQYNKSKDWKTTYRLQYANNDSNDFYLISIGNIIKLNENYSMLIKDTIAYEELDSSLKNKFLSGVAYRDNNINELNLLFKYENDYFKENNLIEISNQLSFQFNKQLDYNLTMSGMYAIKNTDSEIENYNYTANWLAGRFSYDINEDYDIGISAAYLFDNETSKNYVLGLESGYLFQKNMWVSLGYNIEGLSDNKYSNETYNQKGFYLRFRLKLTEDNFKWLQ